MSKEGTDDPRSTRNPQANLGCNDKCIMHGGITCYSYNSYNWCYKCKEDYQFKILKQIVREVTNE